MLETYGELTCAWWFYQIVTGSCSHVQSIRQLTGPTHLSPVLQTYATKYEGKMRDEGAVSRGRKANNALLSNKELTHSRPIPI